MKSVFVAFVTTIALLTNAVAGPRKVLVLPLDGDAPAAQKAQLDESIVKMAKAKVDGDVTIGDTTFAETAAAVGCDPSTPACAETVRTTLGVDEVIYGKATTANGSTTVWLYRVTAGSVPTARTAVIAETDSGDRAEPVLEPTFGTTATAPTTTGTEAGGVTATADSPRSSKSFFDSKDRKVGVGLAGGGVIVLVIGFSFWNSASDLDGQIDDAPRNTLPQLMALHDLEDRAGTKALWGNILVGVGVGVAATGAWFLYRDHQTRRGVITPAPVEAGTGMTLVYGRRW